MKKFRKHSILVSFVLIIICLICLFGYIYFTPFKSLAKLVYSEVQNFQSSSLRAYIPGPSAILLFGMGLLGIICVSIDEKIKKHKRLKMKQGPQEGQDS